MLWNTRSVVSRSSCPSTAASADGERAERDLGVNAGASAEEAHPSGEQEPHALAKGDRDEHLRAHLTHTTVVVDLYGIER